MKYIDLVCSPPGFSTKYEGGGDTWPLATYTSVVGTSKLSNGPDCPGVPA